MACGIPVIALDISEHKDVINNNMTGYLFNTGDIDDLKEAIVKMEEVKYKFAE